MQRVFDASTCVIGKSISVYNVACAFLELEKFPQAKHLLATPGLLYDKKKCSFIMTHLSKENQLYALEKFVQFCRPIVGCDREFMYSFLISEYERENDTIKIKDAWVDMQEEDFIPSEKLKIQMANALESKGFSVPFVIPEIKIDELLEVAIHQKDVDSVFKRLKYLLESNQMTKNSEQKVVDLVINLVDKNKQAEVLQAIFGDKVFKKFAYHFSKNLAPLFDSVNKIQLESLIKNVSTRRLFGRYNLLGRLANLCVDDDLESYVKSLESLDKNSYIPSSQVLTKVIKGNAENTGKLLQISSKLISTQPKFAANTMRACFMAGENSDVANKLWLMLKDEGLDKLDKNILLAIPKDPNVTDQIKEDVSNALKGIDNKK